MTTIDNIMKLAQEYGEAKAQLEPHYTTQAVNDHVKAREALRTAVTEALAFNPDWADFNNGRECGRIEATDALASQPAREPLMDEHIVSACYSFRHDFGLLPQETRDSLTRTATDWAQAFGIGGGQ